MVHFHLLFVKRRFVLNSAVQIYAELVCLVDHVDQDREQSHFFLVVELSCKVCRLDANEFGLNLSNFAVQRTKHVGVLVARVVQN